MPEGIFVELELPQATIINPATEATITRSSMLIERRRRLINGSPIRNAQNVAALPESHGDDGARFAAWELALIVTVDVPFPPGARVTDDAVAVTFAAVPSVEVTLVVNETVPAKVEEERLSMSEPLPPGATETLALFTESV